MTSVENVRVAGLIFNVGTELAVIIRAFKAADRASNGKLNKSSFRKLFEYLIFFNNVAHLFDRIDDSGDGVLSLAEFKMGAHLYAIGCSHSMIGLNRTPCP
jgi:hypothetical protein